VESVLVTCEKGVQQHQVHAYNGKTDLSHIVFWFYGISIAAAAAAGLAAIGAGGAFPVRLGVQFGLFDLPVGKDHLGIVDPALLVFFYG
jgi:hypothetical protein